MSYTIEFPVADLPKTRDYRIDLKPDAAECADIAKDLGVLSIRKVSVVGELKPQDNGDIIFAAKLGVSVTQACVVTLEPVKTRIDTSITRTFTKSFDTRDNDHQMQEDEDETLDPMPKVIDLGLITTEEIALKLPDFPRSEGAELSSHAFGPPGVAPLTDEDTKPFASLAALKEKLTSKNE